VRDGGGGRGDPCGAVVWPVEARKKVEKGETGAARWGQPVRGSSEGGAVLTWAGSSGRPRREGKSGEARAHAGKAGPSAEGDLDCGERRSQPKGKKGGRPGWAGI
jgi:hypothetical protein